MQAVQQGSLQTSRALLPTLSAHPRHTQEPPAGWVLVRTETTGSIVLQGECKAPGWVARGLCQGLSRTCRRTRFAAAPPPWHSPKREGAARRHNQPAGAGVGARPPPASRGRQGSQAGLPGAAGPAAAAPPAAGACSRLSRGWRQGAPEHPHAPAIGKVAGAEGRRRAGHKALQGGSMRARGQRWGESSRHTSAWRLGSSRTARAPPPRSPQSGCLCSRTTEAGRCLE